MDERIDRLGAGMDTEELGHFVVLAAHRQRPLRLDAYINPWWSSGKPCSRHFVSLLESIQAARTSLSAAIRPGGAAAPRPGRTGTAALRAAGKTALIPQQCLGHHLASEGREHDREAENPLAL